MSKIESILIGSGNKENGTLIFSNSLGTHWSMWDKQVEFFKNKFQIILYNTRAERETTIEDLGNDVIALLDEYEVEQAHYCGISLGGLIGQWCAINKADRFKSITIANTAAKICNDEVWNNRIELVVKEGFSPLKKSSPRIWFTPEFVEEFPSEVAYVISGFDKIGQGAYLNSCIVLRDTDLREEVAKINLPFHIIAGAKDPVTTIEDGEFIQVKVKDSILTKIDASHISNIERSEHFNQSLLKFIEAN